MALNLTPKEEAEEKELYAMLYPTEGIAIDSEGKAKNKKLQGLLDAKQEEEEEEEETSFSSPIAMGLLGNIFLFTNSYGVAWGWSIHTKTIRVAGYTYYSGRAVGLCNSCRDASILQPDCS